MKIRKGFVSNSSSSSFVLAAPKGTNPKDLTIDVKMNIGSLFSQQEPIETLAALEEYFEERYLYRDDEQKDTSFEELAKEEGDYVWDFYSKAKGAIEDGKIILIGRASSEDFDNPAGLYIYNSGSDFVVCNAKVELIKIDE